MGDELDDLRAVVSEQGLALKGLQAAEDAEERQKSSHAELLEMMAILLKTSRETEAQQKSGREQRLPTADTAGRDAVSPSLERSDDGTGSRKEERGGGAAEADSTGGQLGGRGRDWGFGPTGELSNTAATEGLRSQSFLGQPKMAIPILKGRENVDIFSKQMRVYAQLHRFETVFESDPYIEVGADGNDKETLMAQGVSAAMYGKQLLAWVFLSQALQSNVDKATFHRSTSPRKCWELVQDWYDTKTNAQKGLCMRQLYNFKIGAEDDPVEKLFEMEDLHVKLNNAGMSVDSNTLYACFVSALPAAEYSLEIRDLNLKQIYDRKEIINLVRSKYETLLPSFGELKGSSKSHALVGKGGGGFGGKGGKTHGGRERSGKGKEGDGTASSKGGAGNARIPKGRCFRCKAAGHYSDNCTAKLCERCGGRGHESSKCASPADMDVSPEDAVLAVVGDPGDGSVETTSF